jgi:hypothetical protein
VETQAWGDSRELLVRNPLAIYCYIVSFMQPIFAGSMAQQAEGVRTSANGISRMTFMIGRKPVCLGLEGIHMKVPMGKLGLKVLHLRRCIR